jgi:DNA processing protein
MDEQDYWLALSKTRLPPRVVLSLLERLGSPAAVFEADLDSLMEVPGVGEASARRLVGLRSTLDLSADKRTLERNNIEMVTFFEERYPRHLRTIYDPPPMLFLRGTLLPQDQSAVAMVGSRRTSPYGLTMARTLARDLARAGVTVVSGLAVGADAAAHWGALEAGGRTIAFAACGIDVPYPPANKELLQRIPNQGAILSEYPLGSPALKQVFHGRNRLISGSTLATVVIEAPERSGALISADHALEQGRQVFVVPGDPSSPTASGSNALLREGALPVERASDILMALGLGGPPEEAPSAPALGPEEARVYSLLGAKPLYPDQIIEASGLSAQQVGANLVRLELRGLARRLPGGVFVRE